MWDYFKLMLYLIAVNINMHLSVSVGLRSSVQAVPGVSANLVSWFYLEWSKLATSAIFWHVSCLILHTAQIVFAHLHVLSSCPRVKSCRLSIENLQYQTPRARRTTSRDSLPWVSISCSGLVIDKLSQKALWTHLGTKVLMRLSSDLNTSKDEPPSPVTGFQEHHSPLSNTLVFPSM